jgi:hypothetical protein
MSFIETATGRTFHPLDPDFADICIGDIAHALSNLCRFGGHCRHFYSVAEHSVRVSWHLSSCPDPIPLWGLLHDASEAYLVDVPRPLKNARPFGSSYLLAECRLMIAVCERFGLPLEQPDEVTHADEVLLACEVRDLMRGERAYWQKLAERPHPLIQIAPWSPEVAREQFLKRYVELTGDRNV